MKRKLVKNSEMKDEQKCEADQCQA